MSPPLYRLRAIVQAYQGRESLRLDELCIESGEFLGISGPNGAGKSTLLRLLAFLEEPWAGSLEFAGQPARDLGALRRQATLLLQEPWLLGRDVFENVAYGLRVRGRTRDLRAKVYAALQAVGLAPEDFARRGRGALSGGEAQRVALAARLAIEPQVLLLDEPTSSLDAASHLKLSQALRDFHGRGSSTVVVASHDREWLAGLTTREIRLQNGSLAPAGV